MRQTVTKVIDYFFSIGSPWAFIGLEPFTQLAQKTGAEVRPYLTTVVEENGGIYSRNRPEARRNYWQRDLKRWARFRGKELQMDIRAGAGDPVPASFMVIAAYLDGKDWVRLTGVLQEAFWSRAADIGNAEVRRALADAAGFDGAALVKREADADVQSKWTADRDFAVKSGVFGFPTFLYDGEVYWGQDNLHFLESHLTGAKP